MIAMLEALPDNVEKLLVFGARYEQDLYYLEKLKSFKNLELRTCVSRPGNDYTGVEGRVTDCIHDIEPDDEVYICGNPDMVREVVKTLTDDGHSSDHIYHEDFTLASKPDPLWKSIFFDGNIPGLEIFHKILIFGSLITIPLFYYV